LENEKYEIDRKQETNKNLKRLQEVMKQTGCVPVDLIY